MDYINNCLLRFESSVIYILSTVTPIFMRAYTSGVVIVLFFTLLLGSCEKYVDVDEIESASVYLNKVVTVDASLPNLFKDENDKIWMSYVTHSGDATKLWLTNWQENSWSDAELITQGEHWFINWADFPSAVKIDDTFIAHWLQNIGSGAYAYGVQFATKHGADTWQARGWLHTDESSTGHGFLSLQPTTTGTHAVWLDGRRTYSGHSAGHDSLSDYIKNKPNKDTSASGMTLRYAFVSKDGSISERQELDSLTCSCCQTATAMTQAGLVVAYRDRQVLSEESEMRDIKVLRKTQSNWMPAENLPVDNWDIQACPVNGPVLTAKENNLALVWYSAADQKPRIKLAFSENNGQSFASVIEIDTQNNLGRVGADWLDSNYLLVSWIGRREGEARLLYRIINKNGEMTNIRTIAEVDISRASGVPQVSTVNANEALFVWTQPGNEKNKMQSLQTHQVRLN